MGIYLNIGNAGFQSVRKGLYIDKTGLIAYDAWRGEIQNQYQNIPE